MAWDIKYRGEFTDILGLDWKIEIEDETAHVGDPAAMQSSGNPLTINFLANNDSLFDAPIHGSKVDFTLESDTHFKYAVLYSTEDMQYRVKIYHSDTTLYWQGYIVTGNYSEPYDSIPYSVTVSASCGLGLLKEMIYKDAGDDYYDGRLLASEIIIDILTKIGYTGFTEYINIYEESMTATATYSPFDQMRIDVDLFRDMYCYEVLEEILKPFGACISIIAGQPTIWRPVELAGATVYGRIFTGDTTHTGTSITPEQLIKRIGINSDIRDVNSGTLMIQSPAKKVTIYQDYGNKDSWIENWKFEGNRFSGSGIGGFQAEGWTKTGGITAIVPINKGIPSESDGIVLGPITDAFQIHQTFGTYGIVSAGELLCFEFDYRWFNESGASRTGQVCKFRVEDVDSNYSLDETDTNYADWVTPAVDISITETVEDGDSGWISYKRIITGMDVTGPIKVRFYNPIDTYSIFLGIRNVRFYSTSDEITIQKHRQAYANPWKFKKFAQWLFKVLVPTEIYTDVIEIVQREHIKTNAINGVELEYSAILGDVIKTGTGGVNIDNILEQFTGSLATNVRTLLYRVDEVTLTSDTGAGQASIHCHGHSETAIWNTSLAQTATDFITAHNGHFTGVGVTSGGAGIIRFTHGTAGVEFSDATAITNTVFDLDGTVASTQPNLYSDAIVYSTDWNTRGGSESKELLSIICDEIADQYSRPKQFLSLPIMEDKKISNVPQINILGNFQDTKNKIGGDNRIFVFNSGTFDVRNREWNMNLIEII